VIITLIRHGETEWNVQGRYTSRTELPLSDAGRLDVMSRVDRLDLLSVSRILSSPRLRAIQTAEIIATAAGRDIPTEVSEDLSEVDFGDFEGMTADELYDSSRRAEFLAWTSGSSAAPAAPGGETWQHAEARADRFLAHLTRDGENAIVVSHGYFLRLLIVRAIGPMPGASLRRLRMDNGRAATLELEEPLGWIMTHMNF
jgi:broad specificity phosphatase PhoE